MPKISLNHSDAIELAELLTFLADWTSGSQRHTLADSLATFVGRIGYAIDDPAATCTGYVPARLQRRRTAPRGADIVFNKIEPTPAAPAKARKPARSMP